MKNLDINAEAVRGENVVLLTKLVLNTILQRKTLAGIGIELLGIICFKYTINQLGFHVLAWE